MHDTDLDNADRVPIGGAAPSLRAAFGGDVEVVEAVAHVDDRGLLTEFDPTGLPFAVRRIFTVSEVPVGSVRGRHGHREGSQALFCIAGRIDVALRRGETTHGLVTLTPGSPGLSISGGVWSEQRYVGEGSSLLVMASDPYDPDTYESDA